MNKQNNSKETYAFIKLLSKFYWIEKRAFFSPSDTGNNLMMSQKELNEDRENGVIQDYDWICYRAGWEQWSLNLLDESKILKPIKGFLDLNIEELLMNIAWHDMDNFYYLNRAILYKYLNINDHTIPAIILFWKWGSWKGTLMTLLSTIFWEENVLANLWERELNSSFDTFKGQHLVVEFAEVSTNNTNTDKRVLNKLKNLIWAEYITVNEKNVKQYKANNIAWFFISSNSTKPILLDDNDMWNRRFSVIKSKTKLKNAKKINEIVRDKKKVAEYLYWLHKAFFEVLDYEKLDALENQDKKDLEARSQEEANTFWDWVSDNHPDFKWKKKLEDINVLIEMFCNECWLSQRDFSKYFWHNSKFPKKKIRIEDKTFYWVEIQ